MKLPLPDGQVFPSQPCLFAVELAESGEVQVVADVELAGVEQEEGSDQRGVAADDAKLAAKLLPGVSHVTRTPSPPSGAGGRGINRAES